MIATIKLSLQIQDVAHALSEVLNEIAEVPVPFVLMMDVDGVTQYISNLSRQDGKELIESLLQRWKIDCPDVTAHQNPDLKPH